MTHGHQHHGMDPVGLFAMWNPWQLLLALAIGFLYFYLIGPGRQRFEHVTPVKGRHITLFISGLVLYFIAAGSPLNYYGHHYLFSAHMLQQALMYYMVPPLLILGLPRYLLEAFYSVKPVRKLLETHMLLTIFAFNFLFSIYHLPLIFDAVMKSELLMTISHLILFLSAFQMWWPIINPLPEIKQMSELRKMAYIICGAVLITPACALIIFADSIVYEVYRGVPQLFEWLPPLDDQQLGGILMKLVQEIAFGSVLAYIFFRWFRQENPKDAIDMFNPIAEGPQKVKE
ncbi:cytochrome c oxidase assembly protein [Ammoniphilus sp. 3BR4]|uniref:cytochrome c oxidase assembly protein n=1 Tax=Ammoniphilus sp. 3BR4 TaxID=3158265 RepID=UPI003467829D